MNYKLAINSFKSAPYSIPSFAFALVGTLSLVAALCSPNWLESKPETNSNFVRLGLWKVCFRDYQHPSLKYDGVFNGCYYLYGHKSESIRNWLQPGWFVLTQCLMTCGTLLSTMCLCILIFMHLQTEAEIKIFASTFVFVFVALSSLFAFLGIGVFGAMCFERLWIQYPKYNILSMGYGFAAMGAFILSCASCLLLAQTFRMRKIRYHNNSILYHIPRSGK